MIENFAHHLKPNVQIWRILLGLTLALLIYGLGLVPVTIMAASGPNGAATAVEMTLGNTPVTLAIVLATFIPMWFGVRLAMAWPVRKPLQALFGADFSVNWRDFRIGFGYAAIILILLELLNFLVSVVIVTPDYAPNMILDFSNWVIWLIPILLLILFQTTAEELFFRGFLMGLIWARGGRLFLAVILPAALFGVGHFSPEFFGFNAYIYVLNTCVTGVILGFVTLFRGNLGAAMGIHFVVNLYSFLISGLAGYMSGMALFVTQARPDGLFMGVSMVIMTLAEITAYVIWARRYYGRIIP